MRNTYPSKMSPLILPTLHLLFLFYNLLLAQHSRSVLLGDYPVHPDKRKNIAFSLCVATTLTLLELPLIHRVINFTSLICFFV